MKIGINIKGQGVTEYFHLSSNFVIYGIGPQISICKTRDKKQKYFLKRKPPYVYWNIQWKAFLRFRKILVLQSFYGVKIAEKRRTKMFTISGYDITEQLYESAHSLVYRVHDLAKLLVHHRLEGGGDAPEFPRTHLDPILSVSSRANPVSKKAGKANAGMKWMHATMADNPIYVSATMMYSSLVWFILRWTRSRTHRLPPQPRRQRWRGSMDC